jgi:hypothetical protein
MGEARVECTICQDFVLEEEILNLQKIFFYVLGLGFIL